MLVFGLVMLFGPMHQCTSVKAMKCNGSTHVVEMLMAGLIAVSLIGIVVAAKNIKGSKIVLLISDAVSIAMLIFIPLVISIIIGGCMKAEMACRMKTFPFIYVFTIVFAIVHLVMIIVDIKHSSVTNINKSCVDTGDKTDSDKESV